MVYGFIFESGVKELVGDDVNDYDDIITTLNDIYGTGEIVFGPLDEDSDDEYAYAAIEITCDIRKDEDNRLFSMDLDQIKANDRALLDFIDQYAELCEVAYCNSPRIFFVK